MSLTVALAVLGGLVLAAIIAHSTWQARRASPRKAEPSIPVQRREPTLGESPPPETSVIGTLPAGAADVPRDELMQMPSLLRKHVRLDASIDGMVPISLESPITGDMAIVHLPTARRAGSKFFHIEGLNTETHEWEPPRTGERYSEFQAGVQLANRNGPLNEIEFSEFIQKVQTFAETLGGMVDAPDMLTVVTRARDLDAFAQSSDAVLRAELRSQGAAWSTGYLQQCAARHGFVAGAMPGRMVLPGSQERGDPPVLLLTFDSQAALADDPMHAVVRSATLTLDVPQTSESEAPFATWHRVATDLARDMEAMLVDDEGKPIPPEAFPTIGQQLAELYSQLGAHDLAAGSAAARRLFS